MAPKNKPKASAPDIMSTALDKGLQALKTDFVRSEAARLLETDNSGCLKEDKNKHEVKDKHSKVMEK